MNLQEIIIALKQIAAECEKVTTDNLSHRIRNIEHGILNTADYLEDYCPLGWHPGSEPPKEDGEYITIMSNSLGEQGEICYNNFSNGEWSYTGYDWEPREVLLWIRKPNDDI